MHATVHSTSQSTPTQLVFGRDAILNVQVQADWKLIKQRKQELIKKNNLRENSKRIPHQYHVGDKVLLDLSGTSKSKYGINPFRVFFTVRNINLNGAVVLDMGAVLDTVKLKE